MTLKGYSITVIKIYFKKNHIFVGACGCLFSSHEFSFCKHIFFRCEYNLKRPSRMCFILTDITSFFDVSAGRGWRPCLQIHVANWAGRHTQVSSASQIPQKRKLVGRGEER